MGTIYRKVKKIKGFRSLLLASLSLQELSIVGSCVKRVCGSQQVGESLSSSQHSTVRRKRVSRESEVVVCVFSFQVIKHDIKKPPSVLTYCFQE